MTKWLANTFVITSGKKDGNLIFISMQDIIKMQIAIITNGSYSLLIPIGNKHFQCRHRNFLILEDVSDWEITIVVCHYCGFFSISKQYFNDDICILGTK